MKSLLVVTLVGADRPGLVESVAKLVAAHGGNWLESRMARLGGQFAGVARVELPKENEAALRAAFSAGLSGLSVSVAADPGAPASLSGRAVFLELVGHDRPGIVAQITAVLAAHRVNVEDLSTECVEAPQGGGTLFQAKAELLLPAGVELPSIRRDLEKIASDLMVDLNLRITK